jgi:hypothetical protein
MCQLCNAINVASRRSQELSFGSSLSSWGAAPLDDHYRVPTPCHDYSPVRANNGFLKPVAT